MPSWIEFRLATQGLLRLARFNSDFPRFFDRSGRGALRSFWLMLPIFPLFMLQLAYSEVLRHTSDATTFYVSMTIAYVHFWIVPPVLLTWIAPLFGRQTELSGCIAIYNWLNLLNVVIGLPLLALSMAGVPESSMDIPSNIVLLVTLAWETFLLAHALRFKLWQAGLAALADYLIMHWIVAPIFLIMGGVTWSS